MRLAAEIARYLRAYEILRARGETDRRVLDAYAMQYGVRRRERVRV